MVSDDDERVCVPGGEAERSLVVRHATPPPVCDCVPHTLRELMVVGDLGSRDLCLTPPCLSQ